MKLRKLELNDAPFMLEWMKDEKVNRYFRFDPINITLESTIDFIKESLDNELSYNFAIADDYNEYLGTVSIKNIDRVSNNGEYAIALRSKAQGQGAGRYATEEILRFAFQDLNLDRVYLNVLTDNQNAINFYRKIGFIYEGEFYKHVKIKDEFKNLSWYRMMRSEYEAR